MTGMPAAFACCSTAVPVVWSIESMMRTLTPSPIMLCAIDWNLVVSPWAFWMSDVRPAAWKACPRRGLSYSSYRVEDVVSGRITPTLIAEPLATGLGAVVGGALAEDFGGLVSLQ